MTAAEKKLMRNPEHKPLMDLPPVVQHLMQANIEHMLVLTMLGVWGSVKGSDALAQGCVYSVSETAPVEAPPPPPVLHNRYPVFCGSDRIYKVNLTQPGTDKTSIRYLTTLTCMSTFAGIRYRGSQEWKPLLDTMTHGEPVEVRLRQR